MPAGLRRKFCSEEGSLVSAEVRDDGSLIRPAVAYPVEIHTLEPKAEFILSNAVGNEEYQAAMAAGSLLRGEWLVAASHSGNICDRRCVEQAGAAIRRPAALPAGRTTRACAGQSKDVA